MTLQQERDMYKAMFGEDSLVEEAEATKEELDKSISECRAMLEYSLDHNWKEETRLWRRMLQENKVKRRMLTT